MDPFFQGFEILGILKDFLKVFLGLILVGFDIFVGFIFCQYFQGIHFFPDFDVLRGFQFCAGVGLTSRVPTDPLVRARPVSSASPLLRRLYRLDLRDEWIALTALS